MTGEAAGLIST